MSDEPHSDCQNDLVPEDVRASLRFAMQHAHRMSDLFHMHERTFASLSCLPTMRSDVPKSFTAVTIPTDISSQMFELPETLGPLADTILLTEQFKRLAAPLISPNFTNLLADETLKSVQKIAEDTTRNVKEMIAASMPDGKNLVQLFSSQVHLPVIDTSVFSDAMQAQANVIQRFADDMLRPQLLETVRVISNSVTALQATREMAVRSGIPVEETPTLEQSVQEIADAVIGYLQEDQRILFAFYVFFTYWWLMQLSHNATWQGALSIAISCLLPKGLSHRTPQN